MTDEIHVSEVKLRIERKELVRGARELIAYLLKTQVKDLYIRALSPIVQE